MQGFHPQALVMCDCLNTNVGLPLPLLHPLVKCLSCHLIIQVCKSVPSTIVCGENTDTRKCRLLAADPYTDIPIYKHHPAQSTNKVSLIDSTELVNVTHSLTSTLCKRALQRIDAWSCADW